MSETLRDLRLNADKSVKETAEALNVSERSIYAYEDGTRQIGIEQVIALAKLYDCSEREIIDAALNSHVSQ